MKHRIGGRSELARKLHGIVRAIDELAACEECVKLKSFAMELVEEVAHGYKVTAEVVGVQSKADEG